MKNILFLFIPLILWSCDDRKIMFSEEVIFENHWSYNEPLNFSFEVKDTESAYDLILEIEHDAEYGFQNFYTKFTTTYPDGNVVNDIVSMELADKFGQWKGKCSGESCNAEILLSGNTLFKNSETHQIQIEQYTRTPLLDGIRNIRFLLVKK